MSVSPQIIPAADNAPPPVLLSYQREWVADQSLLKVIEKSRRTGITWAEAADNVLIAASDRSAGGQNVYYIAYNQDMTIEYIQACSMWARAFNRAAAEIEEGLWDGDEADKHIKTFTIRFPQSGFRIVALTSRPSNLRGRQGVIVIDEAAFHDQLDELLKAAMAMLIWGGKVRVISTHNGVTNPFAELIESIRAEKRSGSVHRITFQDAVAQGLYQRVCLRAGLEWTAAGEVAWMGDVYKFYAGGADEELDCIPSQSGGAYLPLALIDARMAPVDAPIPITRAGVAADTGVAGFQEETAIPEVECVIVHDGNTSIMDLASITDGTLSFDTDSGKSYVLSGVWNCGGSELSKEELQSKWQALRGEEV